MLKYLVFMVFLALPTSSALAARVIGMEIWQNEEMILRSRSGDDGKPDADAVWLSLQESRFEPVDGYSIAKDADELVLKDVVIKVKYGGQAKVKKLVLALKPHPDVKPGDLCENEEWMLNRKDVLRTFDTRLIRRRDVRRIRDPQKTFTPVTKGTKQK